MDNQQIKKVVSKRLLKPALALMIFHLIGSMSLRYFNSTGELSIYLILMFIVMNIFFLMALMVDLLVKVLTDLNNIKENENKDKDTQ